VSLVVSSGVVEMAHYVPSGTLKSPRSFKSLMFVPVMIYLYNRSVWITIFLGLFACVSAPEICGPMSQQDAK